MVQATEEVAVRPDLSQALVLLGEMNISAHHVASLVDNMIQRVRRGEMSTDQGLSFLEMKYNTLLSYLINLTFIVLRKCSGERIETDPCIDRLIEIRTVLEKIRPIDQKLKYQIDKIVKSAVSVSSGGAVDGAENDDPSSYRANPDNMLMNNNINNTDNDDDDDDDGVTSDLDNINNDSDNDSDTSTKKISSSDVKKKASGIYVPPKLAAVHYLGDETVHERNKKTEERVKKRALSSAIMQDLREEYLDTPLEINQTSRAQQILTRQQQEREEYEETYLTRLPMTRADKHKRRQLTTLGTLGDEVTHFMSGGGTSSGGALAKKRKRQKTKGKKTNFRKKQRFH